MRIFVTALALLALAGCAESTNPDTPALRSAQIGKPVLGTYDLVAGLEGTSRYSGTLHFIHDGGKLTGPVPLLPVNKSLAVTGAITTRFSFWERDYMWGDTGEGTLPLSGGDPYMNYSPDPYTTHYLISGAPRIPFPLRRGDPFELRIFLQWPDDYNAAILALSGTVNADGTITGTTTATSSLGQVLEGAFTLTPTR
jgi:hypothetical protein